MSQAKVPGKGFSTRAIHHGYDPYEGHGAVNPPLYLSSTFAFPTVEDGSARFAGPGTVSVASSAGEETIAAYAVELISPADSGDYGSAS